jgi:Carboxypeptidase regulatory-like domain
MKLVSKRASLRSRVNVSLATAAFSLASVLALLPSRVIEGQAVANAKMHGIVTDSTGAIVPNATVVAVQTESRATATTVTSESGSYTLPNLPVGSYTLKIIAPGFQTYSRTGILLQVSNDVEVDAPLTIGSTDMVITVEGGGTQLQTEDNAIITIIDRDRTVDLPLNGRNAANLVLLSGGAAPTGNGNITSSKTYGSSGGSAIGGSVNISVSGGQGNQINFLLDGGDNNDPAYNTNLPFPFPDALQEFSVQTTGLASQYGVHPSGTVNIVTKSGGNQIHGGVFEFLRNNYANASNRISGKVDQLKRNQYGGYFGGPIFHDKTFFFGGYQGTALRISPSNSTANIPTLDAQSGNWSPYFQTLKARSSTSACPFNAAGATKLLAAGFTTANAANCSATISPSLYSPVALNVEKILPTSSVLDATGAVSYQVPQPQNENQWIGRLDHNLTKSQTVFARYFQSNYSSQSLFNGNLLNNINAALIDRDKVLTLGHNITITPNITNALRLTGNRLAIQRTSAPDLPNFTKLGANITSPVPNFLYLSVTGGFIAACGTCSPTNIDTNQLQVADDLSMVHGKHFLQFGFDYINQQYNGKGLNNQNGQFFFTGTYSGFGLVDLLLGAPSSFSQANGGPASAGHYRQNYFGYYAQDTFRPLKNLTVNYGLRWEPWFPTYEKDNKGQTFSQDAFNSGRVSTVYPNAPAGLLFNGDAGVSRGFITSKMLDFSPRIGFALDPNGKGTQSLRGSYSLLFDEPSVLQSAQAWAAGVPFGQSQTINLDNATYKHNLDNPWQYNNGVNPFPTAAPSAASVFPTAGITPQADPAGQRRSYMNQWNLSYQIQVSPKWLLSASYLGTYTVHLWGYQPLNYDNYYAGTSTGVAGSCGTLTPVPAAGVACSTSNNSTQRLKLYQASSGVGAGTTYGVFSPLSDYGMANYNGLILSANHQVANNFTVLANYTYSKCLSNENFTGDNTPVAQNPLDHAAEYGPCNFDVTHNLTVSGVLTSPKFNNRLLNQLGGGWQVSPLATYRTGQPFSVTDGTDNSLTAVGQDRPNVVTGVARYNKNFYTGLASRNVQWFNPGAFAVAGPGVYGNERPFLLRGPGFANVDVAVSKYFNLYERSKLELRGEAFNVLNHPNYGLPISALSSSATVGQISTTANDPRLLQIAAKITF